MRTIRVHNLYAIADYFKLDKSKIKNFRELSGTFEIASKGQEPPSFNNDISILSTNNILVKDADIFDGQ